jgi:hypothetical protein
MNGRVVMWGGVSVVMLPLLVLLRAAAAAAAAAFDVLRGSD